MSAKAASAIRRSGVKIRSLGSGHTSLNLVISELSSVRQQLKDSIAAQQRASTAQYKWCEDEDIASIKDVLCQLAEVQEMWIEAQREFLASLKEYKRMYEHILESEKKLDTAKKQLSTYEEKEKKYDKELSKGSKDPENAKRKLKIYRDAKVLAESEVIGQEKETLAIKLMSIKSGLLDHSRSWAELGQKCSRFAKCQQEMAVLIPDISPQTDSPPPYTGARQTKALVRDLRLSLSETAPSYNTSTASSSSKYSSPPPYYYSSSIAVTASHHTSTPSHEDEANDSFDSFDES